MARDDDPLRQTKAILANKSWAELEWLSGRAYRALRRWSVAAAVVFLAAVWSDPRWAAAEVVIAVPVAVRVACVYLVQAEKNRRHDDEGPLLG